MCRSGIVTDAGGTNIEKHRDAIGKWCPAAGHPIHIADKEDV